MKKTEINNLIEIGYNCMPIGSDKTPLVGWKKYQDEKINSLNDFSVNSDYYALICGFNDVECIDIDLKILPAKVDRDKFAKELFEMIDANIDDFKKRFVIKKTVNNGYHIIYRASNIEGNQKLATLENYTEAIIETRGLGGYICMYEKNVNNDYKDIPLITDEERDIIIGVCRSFNQKHDKIVQIDHKTVRHYQTDDKSLTPWDDYNNKTNIFDIINDDFEQVGYKNDKILIRRYGAKSPHSGYVFNNNSMYLFSTGTIYDAQKLITPFVAYTIKFHRGNFSAAASELYSKGFGDRKKPTLNKKIDIVPVKKTEKIVFPAEIFPDEIHHYMNECVRTLNNSIDYLGCSFLWLSSLVIGNALKIEVKKGWYEISTIWMAIVGEAGIGKTPSVDSIIRPLDVLNGEEKKRYKRDRENWDIYKALSKKEKQMMNEVKEPKRTQFIVDDVTIEALINLHAQNPNGVGVHKDELAGWFKDMNKYKEGSDKEQWLSSWSGKGISVDRITRQSDYIAKPILPVLGGIQPSIMSGFFTSENIDNGFIDRMLFTYPDLVVENYNESDMDNDLIRFYDDWVRLFHAEMRKITAFDESNEITPNICTWSKDAKKEWMRCFNELTKKQNSDDTPEFLKSMLPKMKSYLPRFSMILNTIHAVHNGLDLLEISIHSVKSSMKLVNYFIGMAEKLTLINTDNLETFEILNQKRGQTKYEKLKALYESGKDFNKSIVAKNLKISRTMLYKYIKKIENGD